MRNSRLIPFSGALLCLLLSDCFAENTPAFDSTILRPFETDYCTGFPEGTRNEPGLWKHCCIEHDLHFWAGGSLQARRRADRRIQECIREAGAPGIARLMYLGIRIGALSPFKIQKKKWGNAWVDGRGDRHSLTAEDILLLEEEFRRNPSGEVPTEVADRLWRTLRDQLPCPDGIRPDGLREDKL